MFSVEEKYFPFVWKISQFKRSYQFNVNLQIIKPYFLGSILVSHQEIDPRKSVVNEVSGSLPMKENKNATPILVDCNKGIDLYFKSEFSPCHLVPCVCYLVRKRGMCRASSLLGFLAHTFLPETKYWYAALFSANQGSFLQSSCPDNHYLNLVLQWCHGSLLFLKIILPFSSSSFVL